MTVRPRALALCLASAEAQEWFLAGADEDGDWLVEGGGAPARRTSAAQLRETLRGQVMQAGARWAVPVVHDAGEPWEPVPMFVATVLVAALRSGDEQQLTQALQRGDLDAVPAWLAAIDQGVVGRVCLVVRHGAERRCPVDLHATALGWLHVWLTGDLLHCEAVDDLTVQAALDEAVDDTDDDAVTGSGTPGGATTDGAAPR